MTSTIRSDNTSLLFFLFFTFLLSSSSSSAQTYNVMSYGAKPDGKTDSTKAFVAAWVNACASVRPVTVIVPKGQFLLRSVVFDGTKCKRKKITVRIDGTLVAPSDYRVIGNAGYWIFFNHVDGVSVYGGVLDAQGAGLWGCKLSGKNCPSGATTIGFQSSSNIVVSGLTSLNSQMFHIVVNGCRNVKLQGVKVSAAGNSPNTDGIHVQSSSIVSILNSNIATGDDCVSIGPGTNGLWIENVACGPGHGISIGSLGKDKVEAGVQNVTVKTATFTKTENGVRIKSWARPSTGFVNNVRFIHCVMNNVQNPIVIDQNYCPGKENCPGQVSGVKVSDVLYMDIHGTSETEIGVKLDCSPKKPCTGIRLQGVKLTYQNKPVRAACSHAGGIQAGFLQPSSCL
ncbi:PREDICTED: polygalacturonase-like [Tarenaya hassleriana]|uniref:polygalacturonase-like n=1 Tax=Tarenaya hassleriana TaxID=28532 RepID=UPI00053C731D|nr:PREDICTED: polygalacturonase-like [Tarenaya hassleriana]